MIRSLLCVRIQKGSFVNVIAAHLLIAFAGSAVAASPVPPEMAAWIEANSNGGYNITPTGIDDSDHIQWAVDNADSHGQILLKTRGDGASDFYLSRGISKINFVGSIRGEGIETTVVHTLEGFAETMPFDFRYDRRLGYNWVGQGSLTVGDFKLVVDGPAATWNNHGEPSVEVAGVVLVVDHYVVDLWFGGTPEPWPDTGVDIAVQNIWAVGERKSGQYYPWRSTLLWPVDIEFVKGGDITIHKVRADETSFTYVWPLIDSNVEISEIEINAPEGSGMWFQARGGSLTVRDSAFNSIGSGFLGMIIRGPYGGNLVVRDIITKDASGIAFSGHSYYPPTTIAIFDNQIDQPANAYYGGIEIWDGGASDDISIFDNTISSEPGAWPAIFIADGDNVHILGNSIDLNNRSRDSANACGYSVCNAGIETQSSSAVIHDNTIVNGSWGIFAGQGSDVDVRFNKIWRTGKAIAAFEESTVLLEGNNLKHNEMDIHADETSSITQFD